MTFILITLLILAAFHVADFVFDGDEGWDRMASLKTRRDPVDFSHRARGGDREKTKRSEAVQSTDRRRTKNKNL
ncbi:MAG: hypothetical protein WCO94_14465 [Verrucomicrobiota bacterium]